MLPLEGDGKEGEEEEQDPFSDEFQDDQLSPVEKLDKYFQSDDVIERFVSAHMCRYSHC